MSFSPAVETQNFILHALASLDGSSLTNLELSSVLSKPIIQINRALNSIMQAKVPMVELTDTGYRFIGNPVNLPPMDGVANSLEDQSKPDPVDFNDEKIDADSSANPKIVSAIASMFGKKKIMEEDAAIEAVGASKLEFNAAANELEKMGGLKIVVMDDYEERVFRKTNKTPDFINYYLKFEEQEPEVEVESNDNISLATREPIEVTETFSQRPVKANAKSKTAGDEIIPIMDECILKYIGSEGKASESGTGRFVSAEISAMSGMGKVGRPRVMKRVLELVDMGLLTQFEDDAGVRFKIPGTDGVRLKGNDKKDAITVVKDTNVVATQKKRGRPLKAKITPVAEDTPKTNQVKDIPDSKPAEAKVVTEDIGTGYAMTTIRAMLEQGRGSDPEVLTAAFKSIFDHIDAQEAELVKWRAIGANMINQMSKM